HDDDQSARRRGLHYCDGIAARVRPVAPVDDFLGSSGRRGGRRAGRLRRGSFPLVCVFYHRIVGNRVRFKFSHTQERSSAMALVILVAILFVLLILGGYFVAIYNGLIALKNNID